MTIFDRFRRENSNISNFLPINKVNFDTKIKNRPFFKLFRICRFGTKSEPLTHCVGPAMPMADCSSRKNSGMLK